MSWSALELISCTVCYLELSKIWCLVRCYLKSCLSSDIYWQMMWRRLPNMISACKISVSGWLLILIFTNIRHILSNPAHLVRGTKGLFSLFDSTSWLPHRCQLPQNFPTRSVFDHFTWNLDNVPSTAILKYLPSGFCWNRFLENLLI